jgi:hypothetical protein
MRPQPLTLTDLPALRGVGGIWRDVRRWRHQAALAAMVLAVSLVAVLAATGFAVHNQRVDEHRAALTEAFFKLYGEPPVSESWVRLSEAWRAYQPELDLLLERVNEAGEADLAQRALEWDYTVNRIIEDEGLERDVEVVFRFFRAVGRCVSVQHCDPAMTAAYFGRDPWAFRNMHHPFLKEAYPGEDVDGYFKRIAPHRSAA